MKKVGFLTLCLCAILLMFRGAHLRRPYFLGIATPATISTGGILWFRWCTSGLCKSGAERDECRFSPVTLA